jgi:hypothetical protein
LNYYPQSIYLLAFATHLLLKNIVLPQSILGSTMCDCMNALFYVYNRIGHYIGVKTRVSTKFINHFYPICLAKKASIPETKNNYQLISRILFLSYHLSGSVITGGILLPTLPDTPADDSERAAHLVHTVEVNSAGNKPGYTWHYSMQGLPIPDIAIRDRRLLPHVFTLIPQKRDSYFLWHCLFPPGGGTRLFTGALLCTVRTFLSHAAIRSIARLVVSTNVSHYLLFK